MKCGKIIVLLSICMIQTQLFGQIQYGKISYDRRSNLYKKITDERMRNWIKEENKIAVDRFTLFFNDSCSFYTYVEPEEKDHMNFLTVKNNIYNNSKKNERTVYMDLWGSQMTVTDSLINLQWKITDKTRKIAGYECIRAIWQKDDSTRIYAWFATDIVPTVGPENIRGLPGAILGLATEDGGVVIFATEVKVLYPTAEQITPPKKKGKNYTEKELKDELTKKMQGEKHLNILLREFFFW